MAQSIREVMTADPRTVESGATVAEAAREMRDGDVGSVVVVENGTVAGIVTDRDIAVRVVAQGLDPDATRVSEVATMRPVTLTVDQSVDDAIRLVREQDVRRIVVVQDDRAAGSSPRSTARPPRSRTRPARSRSRSTAARRTTRSTASGTPSPRPAPTTTSRSSSIRRCPSTGATARRERSHERRRRLGLGRGPEARPAARGGGRGPVDERARLPRRRRGVRPRREPRRAGRRPVAGRRGLAVSAASPTVAVLGTGVMGGPMARNIAKAGLTVRAWNRTTDRARPLEDDGATIVERPEQAVEGADVAMTMLADAAATLEVADAILPAMRDDAVWLQAGTIGIAAIERCAER